MKAEYCVDYLSHQWSCDDLITTYRETRKQRQKYVVHNVTTTTSLLTKNEKKLKKSEQYKSLRFQNALWRSMARHCTNKLGQSNKLIDPSTVSWQKESDITWLYGPMYTNTGSSSSEMENRRQFNDSKRKIYTYDGTRTYSALQGLKPVLKKQSNVTQLQLPSCSDPIFSYLDTPTWSEFGPSNPTSGFSSSRSSFSSVSSKSSVGVHFNPEIIEIEYQPEYPVSLESSPYRQENDLKFMNIEHDDDDEDDALWSLLVQASLSLKSSTYTRLAFLSRCIFYHHQKKKINAQQQYQRKSSTASELLYPPSDNNQSSLQLVTLLVSMMKSVVSLTTTWLLYQSLSPLSWLTKKSSSTSHHYHHSSVAAGQSKQQSQKSHLIIL